MKTKTSHLSLFLYWPTNIVSVWASKIHLNQWNIISITLQKTWQEILCFHEIAMRANLWPVLLNRDPHTVLLFVVLILVKQQTFQICFSEFLTVQGECKYNTVYFTLWHFQVPSGTFKHFQTLSGATHIDRSSRYWVNVVSMLECNDSFQCCTTRTEDSSS